MFRPLTGACALSLLIAFASRADDKKDAPALSGTWLREANGLDLKLEFSGKDTLKIAVFGGDNGVIVTAKYTVDKDGRVTAKVTDVEEKGKFPAKPPKGLEVSFKWKVKGDTATLEDLKGEGVEDAKPVFEGEYQRKKSPPPA
ncbi:MAG TPA: hypothetical protein VKE74_27430 [Gemmataceae bacterium]|nr:hypothetical protein [Gemmataceae bacterium]